MPPSTRVRGRWVAPDGTLALTSRYRAGEHTPDTRAAHAADTTSWRRTLADAEFSPELRARFLDLLRETGTVKATARELGLTPQRVYGRMTRDAQFAAAVEKILAMSCAGGDRCGTERGYRAGGRCADCRRAKRATR